MSIYYHNNLQNRYFYNPHLMEEKLNILESTVQDHIVNK